MNLSIRLTVSVVTLGVAILGGSGAPVGAATLLATDFAGRTVSGKTANDITWTSSGLSAPSSLTAVDEPPTSTAFSALFDTPDAQGYFAPDKNIDNEGPWSATFTVTPTSPQISLASIDLGWQHFTNTGAFQGPARGVQWTVSVTGSSSGLLGTAIDSANAVSGLNTLAFSSPLALSDSETYDVRFFVETTGGQGNNTGFDALTFNGEIVPEPGVLGLVGLGAAALLLRRRV